MKRRMRKRMERIHLALCRLCIAQRRSTKKKRIDYWGDLDTQSEAEPHELRPSFMDMANVFDSLLQTARRDNDANNNE